MIVRRSFACLDVLEKRFGACAPLRESRRKRMPAGRSHSDLGRLALGLTNANNCNFSHHCPLIVHPLSRKVVAPPVTRRRAGRQLPAICRLQALTVHIDIPVCFAATELSGKNKRLNLARIERTTLRILQEKVLESHALPLCQRFM